MPNFTRSLFLLLMGAILTTAIQATAVAEPLVFITSFAAGDQGILPD